MAEDRYNQPKEGATEWNRPLNENFADLGIEVTKEVETWGALPNPADVTQSSNGQWPVFRVRDDRLFVRVDDTGRQIIGGLGSERYPLPVGNFQQVRSLRVDSQNISGSVFAREFKGGDLSAKLGNALQTIKTEYDGQGRINVTPKPGGDPWHWTSTLSIEAGQFNGIDIEIAENVSIEFDVDGYCLDITGSLEGSETLMEQCRVAGGVWIATPESNPKGWLRLRDSFKTRIEPRYVECLNESGDATGIFLEHDEKWVENTEIRGHYWVDRGIDSLHGAANPEVASDHNSFQATHIHHATFHIQDFGIRLRGKWMYCSINEPTFWHEASDSIGVYLDGPRMDGTVIQSPKWEDTAERGDTYAFGIGESFDGYYGPLVVGGHAGTLDGEVWLTDGASGSNWVNHIESRENRFQVRAFGPEGRANGRLRFHPHTQQMDLEGSINLDESLTMTPGHNVVFDFEDEGRLWLRYQGEDILSIDDGHVDFRAPARHEPRDVRTVPSPQQGWMAYHDGSGDQTEGPAFFDGSQWRSVVSGNAID